MVETTFDRREILSGGALLFGSSIAASAVAQRLSPESPHAKPDVARYGTPFKLERLILASSGQEGDFDSQAVDGIFVFSHAGRFFMTYQGFDGVGYQTGIAVSDDLLNWKKQSLIFPRRADVPWLNSSAALTCIVRSNDIWSAAPLKKFGGRYLGTWHAYPGKGYEAGKAVIGLAWSDDLVHWEPSDPILRADDGASWERGGLYRSYLLEHQGIFYLYYNAKNVLEWPWHEQWGVAISKDLKSWKRFPGNPLVRNGSRGSPDELFASDPFVVRDGSSWIGYYFGLGADMHARDLLAIGTSPTTFIKSPEILIGPGSPGTIDDKHAHKPVIICWRGDLYHFYTAVHVESGREQRGITVARSRPWSASEKEEEASLG